MKQVVQIRCKNNKKTLNFAIGSTLSDIFNEFGLTMEHGPMSAKVNNKVEGLRYRVYHNKDVESCRDSQRSHVYSGSSDLPVRIPVVSDGADHHAVVPQA